MRISVIVALHRLTPEALQCLQLTLVDLRPGDQLLAISDQPIEGVPAGVEHHVTGSSTDTSPAEKRDAAMQWVSGEICAFIDDDAYPEPGWLQRIDDELTANPQLGGVGGPGITPPGGGLAVALGGAFYESRFGSGNLRHRFVPVGSRRPIDDWPAYNFAVRTDALRAVGGWGSKLYGGEDTKLCLALVAAGYQLEYVPELIVFHHRRALFGPLWRQVGNIGYQRGRFVRIFPETSRRPTYFLPSVALIAGPVIAVFLLARRPAAAVSLFVTGWGAVSTVSLRDGLAPKKAALTPLALATGHAAYGWHFLRGLFRGGTEDVG